MEDVMREVVGKRADYYLAQFRRAELQGKWFVSWNWAAFGFSTAWFAYRGMPGAAILNALLPVPFMLALHNQRLSLLSAFVPLFAYAAIAFVLIPLFANALYYQRVTAPLVLTASPSVLRGLVATVAAVALVAVTASAVFVR